MLEDQVAFLLQKFLGNYVRGLSKEALKISVWRGDVELTNMQLKPEALNALKLPVKVKGGFLGSVKLKVPWSRLGQDPVLVSLDRIFLLAEPATQVEGQSEDAVQEAKKSRVREIERKLLEKSEQVKLEMNKSWLGSLINTIIGNLKLSISNIHIRYEDAESNPGHPFAAGITLEKLSAVTIDDNGMETFATGGALNRIQKSVELGELAVYLDSDIVRWHVDKPWEDLHPVEWFQIFRFGTKDGKPADQVVKKHSYVLEPVSGNAKYTKLQKDKSAGIKSPLQKAAANLDVVTLCLPKDGYRDVLKLADNFTAFNQRLKYAHFRPLVSAKSAPRAWWKYAYKAVSDQIKKASGKLSWEQVVRYASLRKRYVSLYASLLKSDLSRTIVDDNKEIEELDRELNIELIVQWRMLAHKFVEQSVEYEHPTNQKAGSWWSLGWGNQSSKDEDDQFQFTDEDWEQLNKLIGYKESEKDQSPVANENADQIHTALEIHMNRNATKLVDGAQELLAELSCDGLSCSVNLYPETKMFDLKLGSYQLSSPHGLIAKSATSFDSLVGMFCYKPFDVKVDWSMVVKASPCYMTYLKDSVEEIMNFFESNDAVSHTMALETAAAVQTTIDEVKRTAQQQVNRALKDHTRFLLDLDIAAPKITIPTEFRPDRMNSTKLLLDLGNLVIRSQDEYAKSYPKDLDMYLQFDLVLSDVSAFLVDGDYSWGQTKTHKSARSSGVSILPVIDKCGVSLRLQQIRLENPSYPSIRVALRMPSLAFHFSPARYHRLMQVAKIFQQDIQSADHVHPWKQADFEGWLSLLIRKGMGNREATWQRRYSFLVGPFLYFLESPDSNAYKQYISLRGKQIYQLPAELVGGVDHVLAICDTGYPVQKVVESMSAIIMRCESDDSLRDWQSRFQGAIYRASVSAPIANLAETSSDSGDSETELNKQLTTSEILKIEHVFLTGVLDELKICFDYSQQRERSFLKVLKAKENHLFEFRAMGGQVELSIRDKDLFIGTLVKSLEIEDLVCCRSVSRSCFLARSFIHSAEAYAFSESTEGQSPGNNNSTPSEGEDRFYEAEENLDDNDELFSPTSARSRNSLLKPPSFDRIAGLLPCDICEVGDEEIEPTHTMDSFVKAQITIFDQNSSQYNNMDTEVKLTLATLSFFCRRPTVLAIMEFVSAINADSETRESAGNASSSTATIQNSSSVDNLFDDQNIDTEEKVVMGLLGKGKSRVIFNLILNMARAEILLMNENETKLATLSQENLLTDIKVFPSSFSIIAALGNLRISDDSLPGSHAYFRICDMRNPGGSSFVELMFTSFSSDDDDYEGYEYSLVGKLSEVRFVYLNRFIQEVSSYFMGLVPENANSVVKLKDQVTNSEKWFMTSEIEGSPALKLDLSLRNPIILMPRSTESADFLKLDVVHITVNNTFQWLHGSKSDMNAVHLEILTVQVEDINLNVGIGSEVGESIIHGVSGVSIVIWRSLRDLLHQLPSIEATVKIEELKATLSNKEYQIISECAASNISETPHTVPPLSTDSSSAISDGVVEPVSAGEPVATESSNANEGTWVSLKVGVMINLVELSLHSGRSRDASLATIQVTGAWLLYKSNNLGDGFLSSTLKGFSVFDDREGTEDEFRLAIGRPKKIGYGHTHVSPKHGKEALAVADPVQGSEIKPVPTMLMLDAKFSQSSTFVSLCVQRPQLLVALDFLLAVTEFFVPAVGSTLSNDNSIIVDEAIIVDKAVYKQPATEISLSPLRPLIVDGEDLEHFIYDGEGRTLHLKDRNGSSLSAPSKEPIIYVGDGKKLQFRNVVIKNGRYLDSCILLGCDSCYSASKDDQVYLEEDRAPIPDLPMNTHDDLRPQDKPADKATEVIFELQAIGPELTFYSTSRDLGASSVLSSKLLHAQLDVFSRIIMKGDNIDMTANALGLMVESNAIRILEPFDTFIKYSNASGKTNIHLSVSDIFMNFTFSVLKLFLAVEEDILAFLRTTSKEMTISCSQFDKVGMITNSCNDQVYSFWRPRAPPGFAVLGDYLTPMDKPPTKGVPAVNTNLVRVKRPVSFKLIWSSSASKKVSDEDVTSSKLLTPGAVSGEESCCSIWFPEAPKGYVALGCVVSADRKQPALSSAFCILASLVSPCSLRDCVAISSINRQNSNLTFWRVKNVFGTFLPADPTSLSLTGRAYDLRSEKYGYSKLSQNALRSTEVQGSPAGHANIVNTEQSIALNSGQRFEAVASFQLLWSNQASNSRKKVSVWHPVVPHGMVYFGDIAVNGYEPPNSCIVLRNSGNDELLRAPIDYQLVGQIKKQRGVESMQFWMPQAPPGFVSLGCVACKGSPKQYDFSKLRCLRSDMVVGDQFLEESLWDTSDTRSRTEPFSIWTAGNELGTFIVRNGFKKPPRRFALKLADTNVQTGSDDTVIDAEIGTLSAAIFDDYGGLMVPLCNVSLSGLVIGSHGRADYSNSTASFSLAARSYNDKYEAWEPLIEPVDVFLRYQYDRNALGAASQLRLTSTRDLNVNISVSNANMIIQAYASWSNLSSIHEQYHNTEALHPAYGATSSVAIHHNRNFFIIPQNKLGQDMFIRTTETRGLSSSIRMPSGDVKPVKVPVSKNMLDSHLKGKRCLNLKAMVTVIIVDAQLPGFEGLASNVYTAAIRLRPNGSVGTDSVTHIQSARTSGSISVHDTSELDSVTWNEIFFFKIDSPENYMLELVVSDIGKGDPVGFFSSPLNQVTSLIKGSFRKYDYLDYLSWIELSSARTMTAPTPGDKMDKSPGKLRCAVFLSSLSEVSSGDEFRSVGKKNGVIQISPNIEGPWTSVRLNYAAPAACWRLGNDVVASEVNVRNGNRYVTIRSLVSVRNDIDITLDVRLVSKATYENIRSQGASNSDALQIGEDGNQIDEYFETETYSLAKGWVSCSSRSADGQIIQETPDVDLPSNGKRDDGWNLDTSRVGNDDGWVYAPDKEKLRWPESSDKLNTVNHARQRRWVRNRKQVSRELTHEISVGLLRPGETLPVPLQGLTQSAMYILQLRPSNSGTLSEYSWSSVVDANTQVDASCGPSASSQICVSSLMESEELLYCSQTIGTSSGSSTGFWFSMSIQATEIAKDIRSDPIQDWSLVVKSPLSISNYLPLAAEYSVLDRQANGNIVACERGVFFPGKTVGIHTADIRNQLFLSLLPQKGWLPVNEAVLISHPHGVPSRTITLRSSISGRVVQLIIDQNYDHERPLMAKTIRVYAPYWFSISRCPPLTCRLVDLAGKKQARKISLSFKSRKSSETIVGEITDEEISEGHTIASALNFSVMGLSVSITATDEEPQFGSVKDLSSLSNLDGSLDIDANDADGNCMQLFVSAKPSPYQSVPTKVISIRPFITYTNRLGEEIFIRLNAQDEPKVLRAYDSRVSFVHRRVVGSNKLQVKLGNTEWSYPVEITKEDTIFVALRGPTGARKVLRMEVRGFEEGSRFIVVFRLGPTNGPIRIENRTIGKTISIRQSGFSEDAWIKVDPLSTTSFSWEDPYGQNWLDARILGDSRADVWKLDMESSGVPSVTDEERGLEFQVVETGDVRVARFLDYRDVPSVEGSSSIVMLPGNWGISTVKNDMQSNATPLEFIVEFGVVGISVVDLRPKELTYLYFERVFISYSTGCDGGATSRFKLILGYLQFDNQLPLTLMPVLMAPDQSSNLNHPVFKMTVMVCNENTDGILVYPYIYVRVTDKVWRLNIHEPIVWALMDFYNSLQLQSLPQSSGAAQVDPEIRLQLIDVSEVRLKVSLETAPSQRPHGVLGVWSPVLSAVGNAFKIQVHLRRVMHRDRFMRKSAIGPAISKRIFRDLIHNPLHLLFSVDVLGMTSSTLASLSKGFAELSTDGKFVQLRSKQVRSRRITGVGDGIMQGTEALAQGVAFGVSGVVRKPVESARQNGILGLAHGLGRAFLGFFVQPVSGALDFFSLTVDGIGASCSKCLEVLNNKTLHQRIRNPRATHADFILREYNEKEAVGQMVLYLAEASRQFGCAEIFKEPSKFALTDYYEDHFIVPQQRIVLVTNKRVMLLQCPSLDKMDKKASKIQWDVPWEELLSLELAKAGHRQPSHLLLHLKNFSKPECFVRVIKCTVDDEPEAGEPQAVQICSVVPSSQRHVYFAWSEGSGREQRNSNKPILKSRELYSASSSDDLRFVKHTINFTKIWCSEQDARVRCKLCRKQVMEDSDIFSIWRPTCPDGYISVGDIAHVGVHPPNVAAVYRYEDSHFKPPIGYDLVWRNCEDEYRSPVSIWHPQAPEGFLAPGCVAISGFEEPDANTVYCVAESLVEETEFEEQRIWNAPNSYPWACHIYQVKSDALHFVALRQPKEESDWKAIRVLDSASPDHHPSSSSGAENRNQ
ncbi:Intermembrane lipid transfer protein VPS13 [Linum perenne]